MSRVLGDAGRRRTTRPSWNATTVISDQDRCRYIYDPMHDDSLGRFLRSTSVHHVLVEQGLASSQGAILRPHQVRQIRRDMDNNVPSETTSSFTDRFSRFTESPSRFAKADARSFIERRSKRQAALRLEQQEQLLLNQLKRKELMRRAGVTPPPQRQRRKAAEVAPSDDSTAGTRTIVFL